MTLSSVRRESEDSLTKGHLLCSTEASLVARKQPQAMNFADNLARSRSILGLGRPALLQHVGAAHPEKCRKVGSFALDDGIVNLGVIAPFPGPLGCEENFPQANG